GGSGTDQGYGIALDSAGNAYVTGETNSTNLPTTANGFQKTKGSGFDGFVTKLTASGAIAYSTYLGGNQEDQGSAIALDNSGNAYVAGFTSSTNFPTASPLQATYAGGGNDVFVTKLTPAGTLGYSTYLGGNGMDQGSIAVDSFGNVYVT